MQDGLMPTAASKRIGCAPKTFTVIYDEAAKQLERLGNGKVMTLRELWHNHPEMFNQQIAALHGTENELGPLAVAIIKGAPALRKDGQARVMPRETFFAFCREIGHDLALSMQHLDDSEADVHGKLLTTGDVENILMVSHKGVRPWLDQCRQELKAIGNEMIGKLREAWRKDDNRVYNALMAELRLVHTIDPLTEVIFKGEFSPFRINDDRRIPIATFKAYLQATRNVDALRRLQPYESDRTSGIIVASNDGVLKRCADFLTHRKNLDPLRYNVTFVSCATDAAAMAEHMKFQNGSYPVIVVDSSVLEMKNLAFRYGSRSACVIGVIGSKDKRQDYAWCSKIIQLTGDNIDEKELNQIVEAVRLSEVRVESPASRRAAS